MSDSEITIYTLEWANKSDRWGGNIHRVGLYSTFDKAEQAAKNMGELEFGFSGTPWTLINRGMWTCSRDSANYEMWISEESEEKVK